MGFSRQGYWSGVPCPPPGDLPDPGTDPRSPALWADSLLFQPPRKPFTEKSAYSRPGRYFHVRGRWLPSNRCSALFSRGSTSALQLGRWWHEMKTLFLGQALFLPLSRTSAGFPNCRSAKDRGEEGCAAIHLLPSMAGRQQAWDWHCNSLSCLL